MMLTRRSVTVGSAALATSALVLGPEALAAPRRRRHRKTSAEGGQVVLDWELITFRTVYARRRCTPRSPSRSALPILGFVSLDHVPRRAAQRPPGRQLGVGRGRAGGPRRARATTRPRPPRSMPTSGNRTDAIGPGHARNKGDRIGAEAARDFLASRAGDGWRNPDIHYTKPRDAGVWWPNARPDGHGRAWLGSLRPLFVPLEPQSGPYPLDVVRVGRGLRGGAPASGSSTSTGRGRPAQTATALFHNGSNAAMALGGRDDPLPRAPTRRGSSRRRASSP